MSDIHSFAAVQCPYCGEWNELAVDPSVEAQQYVEDCHVCCRPMLLTVGWDEDDGEPVVSARSENDG